MSYYYLKEDNPFYGSKGNRMTEIIYSRLPSKHKELFSNKKIEKDPIEISNTSNSTSVYIGGYNSDILGAFENGNKVMNVNFFERDPFEGVIIPFEDDDENYEDDYDDDDHEGDYGEGW